MRTMKCSLITAGLAAFVAVFSSWAYPAAGPNGFAKAAPGETKTTTARTKLIRRIASLPVTGQNAVLARHFLEPDQYNYSSKSEKGHVA